MGDQELLSFLLQPHSSSSVVLDSSSNHHEESTFEVGYRDVNMAELMSQHQHMEQSWGQPIIYHDNNMPCNEHMDYEELFEFLSKGSAPIQPSVKMYESTLSAFVGQELDFNEMMQTLQAQPTTCGDYPIFTNESLTSLMMESMEQTNAQLSYVGSPNVSSNSSTSSFSTSSPASLSSPSSQNKSTKRKSPASSKPPTMYIHHALDFSPMTSEKQMIKQYLTQTTSMDLSCEPNGFTENVGTCRPRGSNFSVFVNDNICVNIPLGQGTMRDLLIRSGRLELCSYIADEDASDGSMDDQSQRELTDGTVLVDTAITVEEYLKNKPEDMTDVNFIKLDMLMKRDTNNKRACRSTQKKGTNEKKGRRKQSENSASKKVCFIRLVISLQDGDVVLAKSDNVWCRSKTRVEMERKRDRAVAQKRKKCEDMESPQSNEDASSSDDKSKKRQKSSSRSKKSKTNSSKEADGN